MNDIKQLRILYIKFYKKKKRINEQIFYITSIFLYE